ncbi:hypothetical protein OF83DRAFT_1167573 [Amylostereum chailletii]|nr:hypothetical protein OF83DRAFT_1167573 [Amylostereum chailletii]
MRPDPKKKPLSKSVSVAATARARDRERDREHTAPAPMARSTSQSWSTKPPLPPLPPRARGPASPDSLQVAAQFNAWVYLQGTLHSTFVSAQAAAKVGLDTLSRELDAKELCVRDVRVRSEAEGVFSLLHDLTENDASGRVASVLRDYVVQQKAWDDTESAALQLVDRASTRNPISPQECECCLERISLAVSHAGSTLSRWEESSRRGYRRWRWREFWYPAFRKIYGRLLV